MSNVIKVCPIILRHCAHGMDILGFRHPSAGNQFVKGTIKVDETAQHAAARELFEESGLVATTPLLDFGQRAMQATGQGWQFFVAMSRDPRQGWSHDTLDDHGHRFTFFWQRLDLALDDTWHPMFHEVRHYVAERVDAVDQKVIPYICGDTGAAREN